MYFKAFRNNVTRGLLCLVTLAALCACKPSPHTAPVATVEKLQATAHQGIIHAPAGKIQGQLVNADDGRKAWAYTGIPFAEKPVRFAPPTPKATWSDVFDATGSGKICPQVPYDPKTMDEDCLIVNVWTPEHVQPDTPVMVFIYGGFFMAGSAQTPLYNGTYLASHRDVIIVNLNYRLGASGFLVVKDAGLMGNYGFLDQQLALRWVQQNIGAFGGSPDRVTIFGQSAGAMSVGLHASTAPDSAGLFRSAIMESNPIALAYKTVDQADKLGRAYSMVNLCPIPGPERANCLRSKSIQKIVSGETDFVGLLPVLTEGIAGPLIWAPVIDGSVITDNPPPISDVSFRVPMLMGTDANEAVLFIAMATKIIGPIKKSEYQFVLNLFFNETEQKLIVKQYPPQSGDNSATLARLATDYLFKCGNRRAAARLSDRNYVYSFNYVSAFNPWPAYPQCADAVCHGSELPYVFHNADNTAGRLKGGFSVSEDRLANIVGGFWTSFAANGSPVADAAAWHHYDAGKQLLAFGNDAIAMQEDPFAELCEVWDAVGYNPHAPLFGIIEGTLDDLLKDALQDVEGEAKRGVRAVESAL